MNSINVSQPPVDIKDPRIRITFADVAMRVARDGPMYGVIILVGVLAMKGIVNGMDSIVGAAFALLARSHPPPEYSNKVGATNNLLGTAIISVGTIVTAHLVTGCA